MVQITKWEYSDEEENAYIAPEEGNRFLLIQSASCEDDVYSLNVQDLQNDAEFQLRYWLNNTTDAGLLTPNKSARGTLVTLGHAILGTEKGIPYPDDIIGGVTGAEVKLYDSKKDPSKKFAKVFRFYPVSADWTCLGTLDGQYSEGGEE